MRTRALLFACAAVLSASCSVSDPSAGSCKGGQSAILGTGPWDDAKKCWSIALHQLDCVDESDGGTVITCVARVSTGELFQVSSTQLPRGGDYRACTDAERAKTIGARDCS